MQEFLMKDNEGIFYELKKANMKTAIQELIEWTNQYEGKMISANQVVLKACKMLEKEKEQIIDAYYGQIDGVFGYREEGQEYYNQTYNQNK